MGFDSHAAGRHPAVRIALVAGVVAIGLSASGCTGVRKALGFDRSTPDEFAVMPRAPLTMPPDFALRPPSADATGPKETSPTEIAKQTVFRAAGDVPDPNVQTGVSAGERSLLASANASNVDPQIRRLVTEDASQIYPAGPSLTDRLIFWRAPEKPGEVVDATKEQQRLKENMALNKPPPRVTRPASANAPRPFWKEFSSIGPIPMRAIGFAALFAVATVFTASPPAFATEPNADAARAAQEGVALRRSGLQQFTLANGLQVVVVPNHRVPAVTHMLWVKAGAADEPAGKSGLAHFLEHLMFLGTQTTAPGAFAREILTLGGRHNAFTSDDYTAYYEVVPVGDLPRVMAMDADRFAHLKIDPQEMRRELQVILEERRMRVDNQPGSVLGEQMSAALFLNHPYRLPTIGWEHEIRALTPEDARAFYETWYTPANAVVVVTGDVEPAAVRQMAEAAYGSLPSHRVSTRVRLSEPPHLATQRLELRTDRVQTPSWRRIRLAPSYHADWNGLGRDQSYALEIAVQVLVGDAAAPLYRSLVTDQQLASGVGVGYGAERWDQSTLEFQATLRPGVDISRFETAFEAALDDAMAHAFTPEAVARAKRQMIERQIYERDSLMGPAQAIGQALSTGRSLDEWAAWPERIQAVTAPAVKGALESVLKDPALTAILYPAHPS